MPRLAIHWFRRDLRLDDNLSLNAALAETDYLIPLFIFDEKLLASERVGGARIAFMLQTLAALHARLKDYGSALVIRKGDPRRVLSDLMRAYPPDQIHLHYNRDYSPYALKRDAAISEHLQILGYRVISHQDLVLHEHEAGEKQYSVFTPYKKHWLTLPKNRPQNLKTPFAPLPPQLEIGALPSLAELNAQPAPNPITQAGEEAAQTALKYFIENGLADYDAGRNQLDKDGTSFLSPHLRWGSISIRRCYSAAFAHPSKGSDVWISELAWRDFYQAVLAQRPDLIQNSYRPQYDRIQWENDPQFFEAWCAGLTGYPIVDAAMRQLAQRGWMHNRARMIVASFLCKDLLIDWRWGERYFMQQLLDGDTAANNGGWQWTAGTGTDAAPYFRIFNPTTQAQKFDPQGAYIRHWLPELADLRGATLYEPWTLPKEERAKLNYPAPLVDHKTQREKALALYAATKS